MADGVRDAEVLLHVGRVGDKEPQNDADRGVRPAAIRLPLRLTARGTTKLVPATMSSGTSQLQVIRKKSK